MNLSNLLSKFRPYCPQPDDQRRRRADSVHSFICALFIQDFGFSYPSHYSCLVDINVLKALENVGNYFYFNIESRTPESATFCLIRPSRHLVLSFEFDSNGSNENGYILGIHYNDLEELNSFLKFINKYLIHDSKDEVKIGIVQATEFGLAIQSHSIPKPVINIEDNYGKDFYKIHYPAIVSKLRNTRKGVYIFSGTYGTGKTFFIQHLMGEVDRPFVYLSESMINQGIDGPQVVSLLSDKPNSVLIIEDGEKFMTSRADGDSLVGSLLNCADGILGNIIKASIIITHNQMNPNIDPALKRKGRLQYEYVFDKLSIADSQNKIDKLGLSFKATEPMTLGDIYNISDSNNQIVTPQRKMGF